MNIIDIIQKESERLNSLEETLGIGSMMPFNNTNNGPRKLMQNTQVKHLLVPFEAEPALTQTGYENRYAEYSSTFITADEDYDVIAKINKFSYFPNVKYYLIVRNRITNEFDVIERIEYEHITENYGILFNNKYLDKLDEGSTIKKNDVVKKSTSYDDYNNSQLGVNLNATYISCEQTKEDSIIISDYAREKLAVPLIKKIPIVINDNDILLNLYGADNNYKTFPDIGEDIKGILCALRREDKEESLFAQSYYRLNQIMMSDDKYLAEGKILDINVYCNNTKTFENYYNSQLKFYYDQNQNFLQEFVNKVKDIIESGQKCSYQLQKMYYENKKLLEGGKYIKDKVFSNIILEIVVMEKSLVNVGDKLSNRYGGKGVVSKVLPRELMPQLDNGEYVDIIFNPSGCPNRENMGQLFELSQNFIGQRIIDFIETGVLDEEEMVDLYLKYIAMCAPKQAEALEKFLGELGPNLLEEYLDTVKEQGIVISSKPISESMDIDRLRYIYNNLPVKISQYKVKVPQRDSNGNIRYLETRRRLVCAKQYIYRLKQYAEEKFSATSLSTTNIQNENTRSHGKKLYKTIHTMTPVQFGPMESGNLAHMGIETVVTNLLITSASPHARRLAERLLTGNPFEINIELDEDCTNRGAEKLNVFFTTMGIRLRFIKKPKNLKNPIKINPIRFRRQTKTAFPNPIIVHDKQEHFDVDKYLNRVEHPNDTKLPNPISFKAERRDE